MNETDTKIVQEFVNESIIKPGLRMSGPTIYTFIASKVSEQTQAQFCAALSTAVRDGEVTGIQAFRGRGGGYGPPVEVKPEPEPEPKPEPKTPEPTSRTEQVRARPYSRFARHVWIGRKLFRVRGTFGPLEAIVFKVLGGSESPEGEVVFNGKRHLCDAKLFEGIIVHCLYAWPEGESDPVLDDGSGIPVELRIAS